MRKFSWLVVPALVLLAAAAGCRDSSGDDGPSVDSNTGGDVTIQEVQNDSMTPGTKVTLKGVVVTVIDNFGDRKGDFWVQEPGGAEYSGVQVFGGPLDQVAALAVGDVVDITGAQKTEFALSADTSGSTLTELEPADGATLTVTKTGANMPITPAVVDALAIGRLPDFMARHAEWEKWEGVVVKLDNVKAFSAPACITSMGDCKDVTYERFDITGDVQVQSALAAMPSPDVKQDDCFTSVTGIVTYFFDYQILPRQTSEIATGGTACVSENTSGLCADTTDNDGNGFADCMDIGCVVASATCRMGEDSAISDAQAKTTKDKYVRFQDAFVMAVGRYKQDVWISTTATATVNQGIQVHFNKEVPSSVLVGKKVSVIGKIIEFNDNPPMGTNTLTEMSGYDIQVNAAASVSITASTQTAATLSIDLETGTSEPYESVLVTLTNVKITTIANGFGVGSMTQAGAVFKFDDPIHILTPGALNTCFASITGIWSYNVYDNNWVFFPSGAGTGTGTCT